MNNLARFAIFFALILTASNIASATEETPATENRRATEIIWEFDPYYTSVGLNIPLTDTPIPTITSDSEIEIYRTLIQGSAIPRYMLLEASVYPMPALGTYLKNTTPGFYNQAKIGNGGGSNIIDSVTAGFQEPWAVSAFFGNIAKLALPGEALKGSNRGYSGYLVSAGSKHIKDNILIDDNWYEIEWKIKGERDYPNDKQTWSFRAGGKFHDNANINNVNYLGIRRSNLNSNYQFLSWIKNTEVDFKLHFTQSDSQMVRLEMILGKKYPLANTNYTPTLNFGFVWSSPNEYSGILRNRNQDIITLILRPSIQF